MASATSSRPTYSASGSRRAAFGALVLANVLWAGSYTAGKVALAELPPVELNAVRFTLAALLLAPVLIRYRKQIPRDRRMLFILLQLSLLGFVLNKALEYIGLSLSTASDVALLIATESLFTGLLSWIFLRERVTRTGVAALAVGLLGVYLIVERGLVPNLGEGNTTRIVGDVLVVVSLLLEAGYTVRGKTTLTTLPPLLFTALTITGSLFLLDTRRRRGCRVQRVATGLARWVAFGVLSGGHNNCPGLLALVPCAACHGRLGGGANPIYPAIAGRGAGHRHPARRAYRGNGDRCGMHRRQSVASDARESARYRRPSWTNRCRNFNEVTDYLTGIAARSPREDAHVYSNRAGDTPSAGEWFAQR